MITPTTRASLLALLLIAFVIYLCNQYYQGYKNNNINNTQDNLYDALALSVHINNVYSSAAGYIVVLDFCYVAPFLK